MSKKGQGGFLEVILRGGVPLALVLGGFFMILMLHWYFWGILCIAGGVGLFILAGES
jgi:hypothetical protein